MQLKYIKESIKQKHANNGDKSLKNSYRINVTNSYRQVIANRKFKLAIRDSKKDLLITPELKDIILDKWTKQGFKKSDITKIGILKALEVLKSI